MTLVMINWVGLLLSTALGITIGIRLRRHLLAKDVPADDTDSHNGTLTDALAYVSGVLGIMLGLMLFFSVQVYEEARQSARDEAVALAEVFENAAYFPAQPAQELRRNTVCLMRSVIDDSWNSAEKGDVTGHRNTAAWSSRVRDSIIALPTTTVAEESALTLIQETFQTAQENQQKRLLSAVFSLPLIVWLVIDLGVAVFACLMIVSLPTRQRTAFVLIGACLIFTMGVVGALSMFATPFTHIGVSVRPTDITSALLRLQDVYPQEDWRECPRLDTTE